ncbi:hypothetical protein CARUB_v10006005mg [Capsella rubella]|uniref:Uncharacterized protein n=1 Tax=Capsella rubella TaxID=81985 RepID=R0GL78_9BRAS|nr:hypothetical protein CARUB_v10006005mg [Capsella rubella]
MEVFKFKEKRQVSLVTDIVGKPRLPPRQNLGIERHSRRDHCVRIRFDLLFLEDLHSNLQARLSLMAFLVTSLIFAVVGIIASICTRICFNKGPSTNLLHLTLVITATVCCWMMWAIVYIAQMNPLIVPILSEVE